MVLKLYFSIGKRGESPFSCHGDYSACIVIEGQLIAVVEECFRRIKHWPGFPATLE